MRICATCDKALDLYMGATGRDLYAPRMCQHFLRHDFWVGQPHRNSFPRSRSDRERFGRDGGGKRYPEVLCDRRFMAEDAVHTFLIRHPPETIASRYELDPGVNVDKIGFESQYEVFAEAARLTGRDPVLIDSGDLMIRPTVMVRAYCEQIGIEFIPAALEWPADRPEWELSSQWHTVAAASSGLAKQADNNSHVWDIRKNPVLSNYLDYHLPFYQELHARRLTA